MARYRVKPGVRFGRAGAGDVVEVEPHKAALVPWCLEEVVDGAPAAPKPLTPVQPSKKRR